MVSARPELRDVAQDAPAPRPRRRARPDRGADRRRRSADDGRGRALQRRPRRADHRHQHGLPGEEGLQRRGRLGAAGRTSRWWRASSRRSCAAVDVPVTLKIRTGWRPSGATRCASRASPRRPASQLLAVHGRTRACVFDGQRRIRHDRRGEVARCASRWSPTATSHTPEKARGCSSYTGADGIMIGRAAQGRPWIFREIAHYLATGERLAAAARRARAARCWSSTSTTSTRSTARARRAHRAQAHRLDGARAARRRERCAARVQRACTRVATRSAPRCNDYFERLAA